MNEYEKELTNYIGNMKRTCEHRELEISLLSHSIKVKTRQLEISRENLAEAKETIAMAKLRLAQV